MKRIRQFRAPIALVFGVVALAAAADTVTLNQSLSEIYANAVQTESISREHALALVQSALEFDPLSSDALFLRGRLLAGLQSRTEDAISDLSAALAADNFQELDSDRARVSLAELFLRTRRPEEALQVLGETDLGRPETESELVARALYVEARAALDTADNSRAARMLADARRLFPDDPRFFLLELQSETIPSFRYRRELDRLIRIGATGSSLNAAILRYALTAPTESERIWGHDTYLALGGTDPAVLIVAVEGESMDVAAQFAEMNGYSRRDIYLKLSEQVGGTAGAYSGVSYSDVDSDGFWEERVEVTSGLIDRWEMDADQNGVSEIDLSFSDGEPLLLGIQQAEGSISVVFDLYPFVKSVTVPGMAGYRTYHLLPFTIRLEVLTELPFGGPTLDSPLEVPQGFRGVDLDAASMAAASVEEFDAAGALTEFRELADGMIVRSGRDTNADGRIDTLVVHRDGMPASGIRDIDGDGYFEVALAYRDGEVATMVIDEDDNGTPDVTEHSRSGGEREWDLDQDGIIDMREFGIWTESVKRQFPFLENRR